VEALQNSVMWRAVRLGRTPFLASTDLAVASRASRCRDICQSLVLYLRRLPVQAR